MKSRMNLIFPELVLYGYSAMGRDIIYFLGFYIVFCKIGMGNDKGVK